MNLDSQSNAIYIKPATNGNRIGHYHRRKRFNESKIVLYSISLRFSNFCQFHIGRANIVSYSMEMIHT